MGLASFDALFLICAIATFGLPTVSVWYKKNIFHTIMPVSYGLTHTARVGSVMATLSVTLERFFAIVFPFKDVEVVKRWLLPCAVTFTVTYNIPKFFEVSNFLSIFIQPCSKLYVRLLHKPYVNGVNLTGQKLSLRYCQSLEQKIC